MVGGDFRAKKTGFEDWLVEKFNLDLSLVARLGGHSQPRTHRGKERFPGMTITYALIQMLEKARQLDASSIFQLLQILAFLYIQKLYSCTHAGL